MDASDEDHVSQRDYGFIAVSLSSKIFMVESFAPIPMVKNQASYPDNDNDRMLTEACPEQCRRGGFSYGYDNTCPERRRRDGMGSTRTLTDMTGAVTDTYSGACPEPVEGMRMEYCLTKPAVRQSLSLPGRAVR